MKKVTPNPRIKGYLSNQNHKIYYAVYGNPKGKTWLFCHGGPGYHTVPSSNLKFFDLKKDQVILFDQRGAGLSKPHCSLKNNNTPSLIADMSKILTKLKVDKVHLFGGSWGSTLALTYAIQNPTKVSSLVIRGIFLARKQDIFAIYYPNKNWPARQLEKYQATLGYLKKKYKLKDIFDGFKILKKDSPAGLEFAKYWAVYEDLICSDQWQIFDFTPEYLKTARAISLIEMYYFINNCFLPENYILENIDNLSEIPTYIVQGAQDQVCPKSQALELASHLQKVELYLDPTGGHSNNDNMTKQLKLMVQKARKN